MRWALLSTSKSGKREVAISLLMFWAFMSGRHFIWVDVTVHAVQNEAWTTLTWATFAFAAGAFGIDFMMKSGAFSGGGGAMPQKQRRTSDHGASDMGPP